VYSHEPRRGGRAAECAGFENRKHTKATADPIKSYESPENRLLPGLLPALEKHPELADLIRAWAGLPEDVRKMILGVVKLTPKASEVVPG
jgi:hypothetical protein